MKKKKSNQHSYLNNKSDNMPRSKRSNSRSYLDNKGDKMPKSKRSQAGVITLVILIVIALVAVIVVYNVVMGILKKNSFENKVEQIFLEGEITNYSVHDGSTVLYVKRGNQRADLSGLKVVFRDKSGGSHVFQTIDYPDILETKKYNITLINITNPVVDDWNFTEIDGIYVYYIFKDNITSGEVGSKKVEESKIIKDPVPTPPTPQCWYLDTDRDGYGDSTCVSSSSDLSSTSSLVSGDCNNTNDQINPGASEICNSLDDNCNGLIDDGLSLAQCPKNYTVTNLPIGSLFVDDCSWVTVTNNTFNITFASLDINFNYKFYGEDKSSIKLCRAGLLSLDGTCTSTAVANYGYSLKPYKIIAPYFTYALLNSIYPDMYLKYCNRGDNIVFRWRCFGGNESEVILYSNGIIEYSYNGSEDGHAVGISYGDNISYTHILPNKLSKINNDFRLEFK